MQALFLHGNTFNFLNHFLKETIPCGVLGPALDPEPRPAEGKEVEQTDLLRVTFYSRTNLSLCFASSIFFKDMEMLSVLQLSEGFLHGIQRSLLSPSSSSRFLNLLETLRVSQESPF